MHNRLMGLNLGNLYIVKLSAANLSKLQSWTKVLGHFCVSGVFFNSHRSNPSPHPTNNVGRVYPEFFQRFNFVSGGGRENCTKISKMMQF